MSSPEKTLEKQIRGSLEQSKLSIHVMLKKWDLCHSNQTRTD
ncbi:hypothetical protein SynMITS9220_01655 [Synechococcus sp. MIT S9220]|nr:hypothetical protein SynMITS9220_01655 [Synechococcus sp. MIT S9220]